MTEADDLRKSTVPMERLLALPCVLGAVICLAVAMGHFHWRLDLFSHFVVQAAIGMVTTTIVAALVRRRRIAVVAALTAATLALLVLPLYFSPSATELAGVRVKVVLSNLHYMNRNHAAAGALIKQLEPDFLVLLELNEKWIDGLNPILSTFFDRIEEPRTDAFGIGLYSKRTLSRRTMPSVGPPIIVADIRIGEQPATFVAVHTVPPVSEGATEMRNQQLRQLAGGRRKLNRRLIVAGDLNATSWSSSFRRFIDAAGLVDTRAGFGVQATWPSEYPTLMRIPIDHVLVSPGITTIRREVCEDIGSDHRPVFVELLVP